MTVKVAIQCTDKRTQQIGTFGYRTDRPLYSVTPVFPSIQELAEYCNKHNIERDYTISSQERIHGLYINVKS